MKNIFFTLALVMCVGITAAQNNAIFTGGNGDGWIGTTFIQPGSNIFTGGNGDGWSIDNFLQPGDDIFTGGIGDGWSSAYRPQGTIPVNFIYFTAQKKENNSVSVTWKTAQEMNSAYFNIERSIDALHYNFIGKVRASGNSSLPAEYIFIDKEPLRGTNYYRLKQVDIDGHFIYTPSRFVQFGEASAVLKFYPNPASSFLNIELTEAMKNEDKVINISNILGVVVDQLKIKSNNAPVIRIDLGNYMKGVYFIQVVTLSANITQSVLIQ